MSNTELSEYIKKNKQIIVVSFVLMSIFLCSLVAIAIFYFHKEQPSSPPTYSSCFRYLYNKNLPVLAAVEACKYYFRENEKFIQKDGRNYSAKLTDIRNETKIAKLYGYFYNGENSYITQIKTKFSYVSLNNEKIKKEYVIQVYAEPFSVNYFTLEMIDEVHGELEWEIESVYGLDFILHDKNGFGAIK
jgi:hypothetical protein